MSPRWPFALMLAASVGAAQAGEIFRPEPPCDIVRLESDVDRARIDLNRAEWELRQARNVARLSDERYAEFQSRSWSTSNDTVGISGAMRELQVRIGDLEARLERASDDAARFDADAQAARQAADAAAARRDDAQKVLQAAYDAATADFERRDDVAALRAQVNNRQEVLTAAEKLATENFEATPAFNDARAKADGLRQAAAALRDRTPPADPQSIQSVEAALADAEREMDRLRDEALAADPAVQAARNAMADVAAPLDALRRDFERQAADRPEVVQAQKDLDSAEAAARDAGTAARRADEAALAARESSRALADELDDCRGRFGLADADLRRAQGDSSFIFFRIRALDDCRRRDWSRVRAAERQYAYARVALADAQDRCERGRRIVIIERPRPHVHFASRPPVEVPAGVPRRGFYDTERRGRLVDSGREAERRDQVERLETERGRIAENQAAIQDKKDEIQRRRQAESDQFAARREAEKKEADAKKLAERQFKALAEAQKDEAQRRRQAESAARREAEKKEADARRTAAALADARKDEARAAAREQSRKEADADRKAQIAAREAARQEAAQRQAAREAERQATRQREADARTRQAEANRQEQAARQTERQQQQQQRQQQNQRDSRDGRR